MSAAARRLRAENFFDGAPPKNYRWRATYFSAFSHFLRHFSVTFLIFFGIFNTVLIEILSVFHNIYK